MRQSPMRDASGGTVPSRFVLSGSHDARLWASQLSAALGSRLARRSFHGRGRETQNFCHGCGRMVEEDLFPAGTRQEKRLAGRMVSGVYVSRPQSHPLPSASVGGLPAERPVAFLVWRFRGSCRRFVRRLGYFSRGCPRRASRFLCRRSRFA